MATLLLITVFIPMVVSLGLFVVPQLEDRSVRQIALATGLVTLALTLILLASFRSGFSGPQFAAISPSGEFGYSWLGKNQPNIRFALGLDGLSLWMFVLTTILTITAILASWQTIKERVAAHYAFLLLLESGLLVLFASLDAILFLVAFEFTLIPLFFLIGFWGGPERRRAAVTFFLYTLTGSLLTLLGVIALVVVAYQFDSAHQLTFSIPELTRRLSSIYWREWYITDSWTSPQVVIFLLLAAGFAIKVPVFPFHTWLPLAYVEAPTAGSILLSGVLSSVGTYGLFRFNVAMTPLGTTSLFPLFASLCVAGIIYGALAALAQTDIKRLLAYSSVSHMGFIALGVLALNPTALDGAAVHMLNHGIAAGALFACVGLISDRYQTRDMNEIGGLWNRLPLLAAFLILSSLASAALPGLNGFVGEFPILIGSFATSPKAAVLAAFGTILGTAYLLLMLKNVVFGPLDEPSWLSPTPSSAPADSAGSAANHGQPRAVISPLLWYEIASIGPLVVLMVAFGIFPGPILDQIRPAVATVTDVIQAQRAQATKPQPSRPSRPPATTAKSAASPNR